jgi:hypothetical protein
MRQIEKGVTATNGKNASVNRYLNTQTKRRFVFNSSRKAKKRQTFVRFRAAQARKFFNAPITGGNIFAVENSFAAKQIHRLNSSPDAA